MLLYYLAPLQNDSIVTSRCMQFTLGDKREVYLLDESVLTVTEKESMREGKRSIGPRMKYGQANLSSFCTHTNKWVCVFHPRADASVSLLYTFFFSHRSNR